MVQVSAVLICSSSRATFATKIQSKVFVPLESIFILCTDKDTCLVVRSLSLSTIRSCKTRDPESVIKITGTIHCKASFSVGHFLTRKWTQSLPGSTATLTHLDVPNKMTCFASFRSLPHLRTVSASVKKLFRKIVQEDFPTNDLKDAGDPQPCYHVETAWAASPAALQQPVRILILRWFCAPTPWERI